MRHAGIDEQQDVVVVGGGAAGLAASRALAARRIEHVVLEAGAIGETWRTQRWDSFRLNTPTWMHLASAPPGEADGFVGHWEVVSWLEAAAEHDRLPVRTGVRVIEAAPGDRGWTVRTSRGTLRARVVVAASGFQRVPHTPALAGRLPPWIAQIHAGDYRRPDALPEGAVLVVGSAQTGTQIAEDLLEAGRRVYLATSRVGRVPRRHRGRDTLAWWHELGLLDVRTEDVEPAVRSARQPHVSGTRGGHTIALQQLAREGITLLGSLVGVDGERIALGGDLLDNVRFADDAAARHRQVIDERLAAAGIDAPPAEPDPAEAPEPGLDRGPERLDCRERGIAAVVWSTGFGPDLGWLPAPVSAVAGADAGDLGEVAPGLHLIGAPWLRRRGSGLLWGFPGDADWVADAIARDLAGGAAASPTGRGSQE